MALPFKQMVSYTTSCYTTLNVLQCEFYWLPLITGNYQLIQLLCRLQGKTFQGYRHVQSFQCKPSIQVMNLISSCFLEIKHLSLSFPQVRLILAVLMSFFQIPQSHAKCIADPTFSEKKCTKIYMNVEGKNLLPCCKLSSCTRAGSHFHAG